MGLCASSHGPVDPEARAKSKQVDKMIQADNDQQRSILKLLLLGAGESGKSTLFKQMIQIYGKGFTDDRSTYKSIIHQNIIESIKVLMSHVPEHGGGLQIATSSKVIVDAMAKEEDINVEKAGHIKKVWQDTAVQNAYNNREKYQLTDSAAYFFERLKGDDDPESAGRDEMVGEENYLPSIQDVLRARVRTTGIVKKEFVIDGSNFELYDVGGQRNERKKWIHCFDNVTAVLFVGVLSEYNQTLFEDDTTNRMEETLKLFEEVVNATYFENTNFILFLNKRDLFKHQIENEGHKLTDCKLFKDYGEEINNYEDGCQVIADQFLAKTDKMIQPHYTCATDTDLCKELLKKVTMIIIQTSLQDAGLV